jgi:ABC-type transporter Mla MlaB component
VAPPEEPPVRPASGRRPPLDSSSIVLVISGPIGPADVPALWEHVRGLLQRCDAGVVVCDVATLADPDAALARLQLAARRFGRHVRLRHACGALQDLLALMGLTEVVPLCE